jgi:hypothetical protein
MPDDEPAYTGNLAGIHNAPQIGVRILQPFGTKAASRCFSIHIYLHKK